MAKQPEITLANLGAGDLMECASMELRKICDNIADPNVKTDAKRKLTISIEIKPDAKGQMAAISYGVKTTMPGPDGGKTMAYIAMGKGSKNLGLFEVVPNAGETPLFEESETTSVAPLATRKA